MEKKAEFTFFLGSQWVHVSIQYILRPEGGSHIPTLRPRYILCHSVDPSGCTGATICIHLPIPNCNKQVRGSGLGG